VRVVPLVVSALCTGACDAAFDLEHIGPPPDAPPCTPVGHDEDRDGLDDGCDPCPFDANNEGDLDGDGIANACDPDPVTANEVLLWSGFDAITRAQFTLTDGSWDGDSYRVTGTGTNALLWDGNPDGVWVIAGVDVESLSPTSYREVGFIFDAIPTSLSSQPNGTLCVLGRATDDYLEVFARNRPANDVAINHSSSPLSITAMHGIMRGSYARNKVPSTTCTFVSQGIEPTISGTLTPLPSSGKLALFAQDIDATFRFLFVVSRP
jgi:hypothetical protein